MGVELIFTDSNTKETDYYSIKWLACELNYDIPENDINGLIEICEDNIKELKKHVSVLSNMLNLNKCLQKITINEEDNYIIDKEEYNNDIQKYKEYFNNFIDKLTQSNNFKVYEKYISYDTSSLENTFRDNDNLLYKFNHFYNFLLKNKSNQYFISY